MNVRRKMYGLTFGDDTIPNCWFYTPLHHALSGLLHPKNHSLDGASMKSHETVDPKNAPLSR